MKKAHEKKGKMPKGKQLEKFDKTKMKNTERSPRTTEGTRHSQGRTKRKIRAMGAHGESTLERAAKTRTEEGMDPSNRLGGDLPSIKRKRGQRGVGCRGGKQGRREQGGTGKGEKKKAH